MPRPGFQLSHHIYRHEPVAMFNLIGIIPPQCGFRPASQFAGRLDAYIFDQGFGMLFPVGFDAHRKLVGARGAGLSFGLGEYPVRFPINPP